MTNTKLEEALKRIEQASLVFKALDEGNTERIEEFDDRLELAGVGVSIWVPGLISQQRGSCEGWQMGYMKLAKRWRTVVRTLPGSPAPPGSSIPALSAPRYVRADVCKNLDRLAGVLACEIERLIENRSN
jgi:hypothetical protein